MDFESYLKHMAKPYSWGSQLELEALSSLYHVNITVYDMNGVVAQHGNHMIMTSIESNQTNQWTTSGSSLSDWMRSKKNEKILPKKRREIKLAFLYGSHYDSVYPINEFMNNILMQDLFYETCMASFKTDLFTKKPGCFKNVEYDAWLDDLEKMETKSLQKVKELLSQHQTAYDLNNPNDFPELSKQKSSTNTSTATPPTTTTTNTLEPHTLEISNAPGNSNPNHNTELVGELPLLAPPPANAWLNEKKNWSEILNSANLTETTSTTTQTEQTIDVSTLNNKTSNKKSTTNKKSTKKDKLFKTSQNETSTTIQAAAAKGDTNTTTHSNDAVESIEPPSQVMEHNKDVSSHSSMPVVGWNPFIPMMVMPSSGPFQPPQPQPQPSYGGHPMMMMMGPPTLPMMNAVHPSFPTSGNMEAGVQSSPYMILPPPPPHHHHPQMMIPPHLQPPLMMTIPSSQVLNSKPHDPMMRLNAANQDVPSVQLQSPTTCQENNTQPVVNPAGKSASTTVSSAWAKPLNIEKTSESQPMSTTSQNNVQVMPTKEVHSNGTLAQPVTVNSSSTRTEISKPKSSTSNNKSNQHQRKKK
ncbi:hypothetical protein C9374_001430 [Naegleria lovaniensis]|uniref:OTU domain-containing protein n=1 Tax=Naegleria lovaniensis TaxID=51637 RepID=A0AA88KNQ0_NAELO|nr:uncharacterized protein C9374_001430 [Naegleria lovaniensis]KAG2387836.1 hypothetical protein C9374_001430 [Naegleria lovaniensis]